MFFGNAANIIGAITASVGFIMLVYSMYIFYQIKRATPVHGMVVGNFQEFSTRGFLWKEKVEYEWNGTKNYYITVARTFKRGSHPLTLYVDEKGNVYEKGNAISKLLLGLFIVAMGIVMFGIGANINSILS